MRERSTTVQPKIQTKANPNPQRIKIARQKINIQIETLRFGPVARLATAKPREPSPQGSQSAALRRFNKTLRPAKAPNASPPIVPIASMTQEYERNVIAPAPSLTMNEGWQQKCSLPFARTSRDRGCADSHYRTACKTGFPVTCPALPPLGAIYRTLSPHFGIASRLPVTWEQSQEGPDDYRAD